MSLKAELWFSHNLSLVLLLQFEATLDAAPCLQEYLPLGVVSQVVDEQASCVHTQVQQAFGKNLNPQEICLVVEFVSLREGNTMK